MSREGRHNGIPNSEGRKQKLLRIGTRAIQGIPGDPDSDWKAKRWKAGRVHSATRDADNPSKSRTNPNYPEGAEGS